MPTADDAAAYDRNPDIVVHRSDPSIRFIVERCSNLAVLAVESERSFDRNAHSALIGWNTVPIILEATTSASCGEYVPDAVERATKALLVRRRTHSADLTIPDLTDAQAYIVQAKIVASLNDIVTGWKVAIVAGRPVGAPLLCATLHASGASVVLPARGGMKIETEIGFTLARDVPAGPIDRAQLLDAIDTIHAAFEIVGARAGEPPSVPFAGFLADNLGNAITVLGRGRRMRAGDILPEYGWIDCDGERLVEGTHPNGDPLAALQAYAAEQPDALGGLKKGQVIITGSFTSATPVDGSASWKGGFEGLDPVEITFAAGDD